MTQSKFTKVAITGLSVVVPDYIRSIDDDLEFYDNDPDKLARIKKVAGFGTRYVAPAGCTTVDLCEAAAKQLIADMNVDLGSLDALIFVIQKPDYSHPGSGCLIHKRLNLPKGCAVFDVNHGCAGYVYGLWLASALLESGACRKILLLAGDNPSTTTSTNRITAPVFGDAGSATIVEYSSNAENSFYNMAADGQGYDSIIVPASGERLPVDQDVLDLTITDRNGTGWKLNQCYMNGMEVFNFTLREIPENIKKLLSFAGASLESIDFAALHQANKQIVDSVAAKAGLSKTQYSSATFSTYGNQSTCSLPAVIAHLCHDKVTADRQRFLLSGFGIGLAWGSALVTMDKIYCSGIVPQKFENIPSREDEIKYWIKKIGG